MFSCARLVGGNLNAPIPNPRQNTKSSMKLPQKTDDVRKKRPHSPDLGDEKPQKRAVHKPRDDAGDGRGDQQISTQARPVEILTFMERGKPKDEPQTPTSRRHDTPQAGNKSTASSRQGKDIKAFEVIIEISDDSSSDAPLAPKKGHRKKQNTQENSITIQPEDNSDDLSIASSARRRLRTLNTSTSESVSD